MWVVPVRVSRSWDLRRGDERWDSAPPSLPSADGERGREVVNPAEMARRSTAAGIASPMRRGDPIHRVWFHWIATILRNPRGLPSSVASPSARPVDTLPASGMSIEIPTPDQRRQDHDHVPGPRSS